MSARMRISLSAATREQVDAVLDQATTEQWPERLFDKDTALWSDDPDVRADITRGLLEAAARHKVRGMVFSSTAAVYGEPRSIEKLSGSGSPRDYPRRVYALLPALKFRSNVGLDLNLRHNKAFNRNFGDDNGGGSAVDRGTGRQNRPTGLNEDRGQETTVTWNNTLNYAKAVGRSDFSALGGSEYITNYSSSIGGSRQRFDFIRDNFQYLNYGGTADQNNGGSASEWKLFSLFSSATYVYDTLHGHRHLPRGRIVAEGSRDKTELITADLDLDQIREVRNVWQFYRDRRPETYVGLVKL